MLNKVFCYRNLNKKGVVWSIRDTKTNKVINWVENIILKDVELKVSEKGRQRVLREKRKNVHAGVKGYEVSIKSVPKNIKWIYVFYDPYTTPFFTDKNGNYIKICKYAKLCEKGLFVSL
jgi:hypothetical protein